MTRADALVVGLGSIGTRHERVLRALGQRVATVSRRGIGNFESLPEALSASGARYVVVANETSAHMGTLSTLAAENFRGDVLIEKPLFAHSAKIPTHYFAGDYVGYHLRFHPALERVHSLLAGEDALEAAAYVGQHLRDWRPDRDYRETASAKRKAGGGVLRDLSHELDYLLWFFGPWRRVTAVVRHTGVLPIETEDIAAILMECERCPAVTVHLNYHDRKIFRELRINTARHTIEVDLVAAQVCRDGEEERHPAEHDEIYRAMHEAALGNGADLCRFKDGLAVVDLIEAIERASEEGRWVER